MKAIRVISILVAIMGLVHMGATFSPLIGGKLATLEEGTYMAMIYMSLMCGLLLVATGSYAWWAISKVADYSQLKSTIMVAALLLLVDGTSAVAFMPHNPFAWTIEVLCTIDFVLIMAKISRTLLH